MQVNWCNCPGQGGQPVADLLSTSVVLCGRMEYAKFCKFFTGSCVGSQAVLARVLKKARKCFTESYASADLHEDVNGAEGPCPADALQAWRTAAQHSVTHHLAENCVR
jgi:hypothetical protein